MASAGVSATATAPPLNDTSLQHAGNFNAVSVVPGTTDGWIVGDSGVILATQNEGQSWQAQASNTFVDLTAVSFSDPSHGWAVGQGTVLSTSNGGQTWTPVSVPGVLSSTNLTGVSVTGQGKDIFIVGGSAFVSTDGGQTWSEDSADFAGYLLSGVSAVTTAAGPQAIAVSPNGKPFEYLTGVWLVDPAFSSFTGTGTSVAALGMQDAVLGFGVGAVTDVGGTTSLSALSHFAFGVNAVAALSVGGTDNYWAVGSTGSTTGYVAHFNGTAWSEQALPSIQYSPPAFVPYEQTGVGFWDATHGVVVGQGGEIFTTANGGTTWQSATPASPYAIAQMAYAPGNTGLGFAVGGTGNIRPFSETTNGVILRTTNDGQSWTNVTPAGASTEAFAGVAMANQSDGFAVGNTNSSTVVYATTDGGVSWNPLSLSNVSNLPSGYQVTDLQGVATQIVSGQTWVWAVGNAQNTSTFNGTGVVLRSENGGSTWTDVLDYTTNAASAPLLSGGLYGVAFSGQYGWAVGVNGNGNAALYQTSDGGTTWTATAYNNTLGVNLQAVTAIDATHAWAVGWSVGSSGYTGNVAYLDPSTGRWTPATAPMQPLAPGALSESEYLYSVAFSNASDGWVVGDDGTFDYTTDGGATWNPIPEPGSATQLSAVAYGGDPALMVGTGSGLIFTSAAPAISSVTGGPQVPCDPTASPEIIGPPGGVLATPDCLYTEPLAHSALGVNQDLAVQEIPGTFLPALPKGLVLADPIFHVTGAALSSHQIAYVKYK
ncbi:MAG: WD40/YVTN/BNR-like repeat-containing protein, partial [Solirubrobacteraceae bacterium]